MYDFLIKLIMIIDMSCATADKTSSPTANIADRGPGQYGCGYGIQPGGRRRCRWGRWIRAGYERFTAL